MALCPAMTLQDYAVHLQHVCPTLPAAKTLIRKLRFPQTGIGDHKINFPIPCTDRSSDSGARVCQIFQELPLWNELLSFINVELRETVCGRLTAARLRKTTLLYNKRQEVQRALICLHWLLTQHNCVDTFEPDSRVLENYPELFCDALKLGKAVKHMRLGDPKHFVGISAEAFTAICKARRLEELTCDGIVLLGDRKTITARMATYIKKTTSLKTLRLTRIWMGLEGGPLVDALRGNLTITKLIIDARLVDHGNLSTFASFVANNTVLVELTLLGQKREAAWRLEPVFRALENNATLCKLGLQNYNFDIISSTQFSNMLSVNTSLQEVSFCACCWESGIDWDEKNYNLQRQHEVAKARWGAWWRADVFVHAIKNSASLRRLEFDINHFLDGELLRLLRAVREKASFRELFFRRFSCLSSAELSDLVSLTGTAGKVMVTHLYSSSRLFVDSLDQATSLPPTALHSFYDLSPALLGDVCLALTTHDSITALCLFLDDVFDVVDEMSAALLAAYLASTTALKEIEMRFDATDAAFHVILKGVSQNRSLEKLKMKDFILDCADVSTLCAWVAGNQTLYHFECRCFYLDHAKAVLVSELLELLQQNYTLTFARVEKRSQNNEEWLVVKQMLDRNSSLVLRAADFALGSSLKLCASAFELVSWHPLVLARVQETASVSAEEARRKVQEGERRLQTGFWALSGVVDEELRCHKSDDGKLQIDELDFDAWLEVRKFLSVADVADSLREPATPHK